jgi:hypothetical protein
MAAIFRLSESATTQVLVEWMVVLDSQNGGDGEHHKGTIEKELLHSSRQ